VTASSTPSASIRGAAVWPNWLCPRRAQAAVHRGRGRLPAIRRSSAGLCRRPLTGSLRVLPSSPWPIAMSHCASTGERGRCARCVPAALTVDHGPTAKLHVSTPACERAAGPSQGGSAGSNPVGATNLPSREPRWKPTALVSGTSAAKHPSRGARSADRMRQRRQVHDGRLQDVEAIHDHVGGAAACPETSPPPGSPAARRRRAP